MPAFFISSSTIHGDLVTMTGDLCHHLRASLRVQIGQTVWLTDERRNRYHARVTEMTHAELTAHIQDRTQAPTRPVLGFCLRKRFSKVSTWTGLFKRRLNLACMGLFR